MGTTKSSISVSVDLSKLHESDLQNEQKTYCFFLWIAKVNPQCQIPAQLHRFDLICFDDTKLWKWCQMAIFTLPVNSLSLFAFLSLSLFLIICFFSNSVVISSDWLFDYHLWSRSVTCSRHFDETIWNTANTKTHAYKHQLICWLLVIQSKRVFTRVWHLMHWRVGGETIL